MYLIAIGISLVALAVVGLHFFNEEMQYEMVEETGEMIGEGTVLIYDAEMIQDGVVKTGEVKITYLGFNPSGSLYNMEMDKSLGTGNTGGIILTNDMASGSGPEERTEPVWDKIDTANYGKKRMAYVKTVQDGSTTETWFDQYTGIEYRAVMKSDAYVMKMDLKSMDVKWQPFAEEIEPSENLGKTLTYKLSLNGKEVGYDKMTIVTNPDKNGLYYTREIMYVEGEGVVSLTYQPSESGTPGNVEVSDEKASIETVDGVKELVVVSMDNGDAKMHTYVDVETSTVYRIVIENMGNEIVLDYQSTSVDRFWEEEE